jgi:hypothetical protein
MMHAFSLLIGSILTHKFAKGVVGKVTQLVKFIKLSLLSAAWLRHHSKQLGINRSLASPSDAHALHVSVGSYTVCPRAEGRTACCGAGHALRHHDC